MNAKSERRFFGGVSLGVGQTVAEVSGDDAWIYITQVRADQRRGATVKIPADKASKLEWIMHDAARSASK